MQLFLSFGNMLKNIKITVFNCQQTHKILAISLSFRSIIHYLSVYLPFCHLLIHLFLSIHYFQSLYASSMLSFVQQSIFFSDIDSLHPVIHVHYSILSSRHRLTIRLYIPLFSRPSYIPHIHLFSRGYIFVHQSVSTFVIPYL